MTHVDESDMAATGTAVGGKTVMKRIEQYKDRWTSYGLNTGIQDLSDRLTAKQLKQYDLFKSYPDKFLERISPDVSVAVWKEGSVLFEEGAYIDLAFFIISGAVEVSALPQTKEGTTTLPIFQDNMENEAINVPDEARQTMMMPRQNMAGSDSKKITFLSTMDFDLPAGTAAKLGAGEFFGEIGALSGWPQSVSAKCTETTTLIQVRLPALRMMKHKSKDLKKRLDDVYKKRALFSQLRHTPLFRPCDDHVINHLCRNVSLESHEPGACVTREGEAFDALYLIRSGFLKLTRRVGEGELVTSYLSKGMTLGEVEFLVPDLHCWETTATAVGYVELVQIGKPDLNDLLQQFPSVEGKLWQSAAAKIKAAGFGKRNLDHSEFTRVALETGLIQGNSALIIDLERCTRCDDCVRACAATHGGRPRFIREGHKVANLEIPKSCYHCRDPICLVGCPTGAIHREGTGDLVAIDEDICIGCSTCANNCPYNAIIMHETGETWPDDMIPIGLRGRDRKVASKCDLCMATGHDPACVRNCPQGCASRIGSVNAFEKALSPANKPQQKRRYLSRRSAVKLVLFLVAILACIGTYAVQKAIGDSRPGSPWVRGYGIAASALLIIGASLGLRRRMMRFVTRFRLGRAQGWLQLHIYTGLLFMLMVLMHASFQIPSGWLSMSLLGLSVWVTCSGLVGLALQRWIPKILAGSLSLEVVYERIPELVNQVREKCQSLVSESDESVQAYYVKSLAPHLQHPQRRPGFFLSVSGTMRPLLKGFDTLRTFLDEAGQHKLAELQELFTSKLEMDAHYTLQQALRVWLYAHIPFAVLLVALVIFHVFTVYYY